MKSKAYDLDLILRCKSTLEGKKICVFQDRLMYIEVAASIDENL